MNLLKVFKESGHREVARHVLDEYNLNQSLHKPLEMRKIQVKIPEVLYQYVKATKSKGKLGERLTQIIMQDVRRLAEEKPKIY